jgi:hypothetical protein
MIIPRKENFYRDKEEETRIDSIREEDIRCDPTNISAAGSALIGLTLPFWG